MPNAGPFKRMPYKPLPLDARERFVAALQRAISRYRTDVSRLSGNHLRLADENLDIGRPTRGGEYEPADEAYASLLEKLDEHDFANVSPALRADILRFYADAPFAGETDDGEWRKVRRALTRLGAMRSGSNASRRAHRSDAHSEH
jgi:hypothetical protein